MQWGSARASSALEAYRSRVGLRGVVAGALLGLATAAPEVSVNLASVGFGWPDLGLGAALGSNVPALPLVVMIAWSAVRGAPVVAPAAVPVQALPYLLVVILLAVLTLTPGMEGLQPLDGLVLVAAWAGYLAHALLRPRGGEPDPEPPPAPVPGAPSPGRAVTLAVPAIAAGALASVIAARRLGEVFGASDLVVGLFVIGLLCALPESFAARGLAREGRATTAVSAAMADGIVSLSVALVPPALAGTAVGDVPLYLANLGYLVFALGAYLATGHPRWGQVLGARLVVLLVGGYAVYFGIVALLLAR